MRCDRPGCRSPTTARPASSRRRRWSAPATRRRSSWPGGRRCAPAPTTWSATATSSRRGSARASSCRARCPARSPADQRAAAAGRGRRDRRRGRRPTCVHAAASEAEVLRHRDVAALTPDEKALLDAMLARAAAAAAAAPRRPPYAVAPGRDRHAPHPAHARCARWASRAGSSTGAAGPPLRRVVLLVDVSASMRPYADAILRLAHLVEHERAAGTGRGVHARHPADPGHAAAAHRRRRAGAGARGRAGAGLVRRHPPRRDARRRSSTAGAPGDGARRRRRCVQRRLGARRRRRARRADAAAAARSRTAWSG